MKAKKQKSKSCSLKQKSQKHTMALIELTKVVLQIYWLRKKNLCLEIKTLKRFHPSGINKYYLIR
jgi:hypothetical protein